MPNMFHMYNWMCKTCRVCVCAWFTQILLQISFGFSYFFPVRTIFWDRASPPHHQTLFCSLSCFFVNCVSSSLGKLVVFRSGLCGYIPRICCVSLWTGNQKRGWWVTAHLLPAGPVHPPPEPTTGCSFISWVTTYKASQSSGVWCTRQARISFQNSAVLHTSLLFWERARFTS